MRRFAIACCAVALVGCTKPKEEPAKDAMAAAPAEAAPAEAAPVAPAPISLTDLAGKWAMRTMTESGDSTLVSYEMIASGDSSGWTYNFPNRKPVPVRIVAVSGDSIVIEAGPFESLLRKGVKVTTRTVNRLQNGKLVGTTTARYATSGPDSVRHLRVEGTRAP